MVTFLRLKPRLKLLNLRFPLQLSLFVLDVLLDYVLFALAQAQTVHFVFKHLPRVSAVILLAATAIVLALDVGLGQVCSFFHALRHSKSCLRGMFWYCLRCYLCSSDDATHRDSILLSLNLELLRHSAVKIQI